jgi:hypothetical protein
MQCPIDGLDGPPENLPLAPQERVDPVPTTEANRRENPFAALPSQSDLLDPVGVHHYHSTA